MTTIRNMLGSGLSLAILMAILIAPAASATPTGRYGSTLREGEKLPANQLLYSPNRQYQAMLQSDGNFAVWNSRGQVVWMTGDHAGGGGYVVVQDDGNIGVWGNRGAWASRTGGTGAGHRLVMQDDGNLVLYSAANAAIWSSKFGHTGISRDTIRTDARMYGGQGLISNDGRCRAGLQSDGNFAVWQENRVVWMTGDRAGGGGYVTVQSDGNIGVWGRRGAWESETGWTGRGHRLVMQDDCNLVLYSTGNAPIWSSKFGKTGISRTTLHAGASLYRGQGIVSKNGRYKAMLHSNGNFSVSDIWRGGRVLWKTGATGTPARVTMQKDGNLGVWGGDWVWASGTGGTGRSNRLVMQDDGNLGMYTASNTVPWSSVWGRTPTLVDRDGALPRPEGATSPWPSDRPAPY